MLEQVISNKASWTRVAFGDVVRLSKERAKDPEAEGYERVVGLEHIDPGDLRIRRWADIADGTTFTSVFKPGQVLFGKRRAYQRKVAVADFSGVCSGDIYVLEPSSDALMPELLPFICQTDAFFDHAVGTSAGSLSPRTNWKSLADFEFLLPPIQEQARLVETFSSMDAYLAALHYLASEAGRLFTSLSFEFFDVPSTSRTKIANIVDYASDGPFGSKLKTEHYDVSGARVIRLNNIAPNKFVFDDEAYVPLSYFQNELSRYEVMPGDIVIAGLGDEDIPAGRSCVVPEGLGPSINKADCFCLRTNEKTDARYLSYFLNSPMGLAQAKAFSQGSTRIRLNLENIKKFTVPDVDLSVQLRVVKKLDTALSAWNDALKRAAAIRELQFSLLNSQFNAQP